MISPTRFPPVFGEIVTFHFSHIGFAVIVIELLDLVLPRVVEVNCLLVERGQRHGKGNFGDHFGLARRIDHHKIITRNGSQTDRVGRVGIAGPVPLLPGLMKHAEFLQETAHVAHFM